MEPNNGKPKLNDTETALLFTVRESGWEPLLHFVTETLLPRAYAWGKEIAEYPSTCRNCGAAEAITDADRVCAACGYDNNK